MSGVRLPGVTGLVVAVIVTAGAFAFAGDLPPGGTFTDDDGNVHEGSIEAIAAEGITKGCNPPVNDLYCPSGTVTRGQMAAFLVRALGLTDNGGGNLFIDDDGSIFENDIDRLGTEGVTRGCNPPVNDRYCPNGKVTRGQMAAFLVRAFGYTDDGGGNLFVDDNGSVFEADIDKLGTAGVTRGCNPPVNDRYCPNNFVTRAQMATFLGRALGLTPVLPPPRVSSGVVEGRFEWLDLSDPAPPDASKITTTAVNGWRARVEGAPGSVAPNAPVVVACLDLPHSVLVTSGASGEFTAELFAPRGCTILVKHDATEELLVVENPDARSHHLGIPPGTTVRHDPPAQGSTDLAISGLLGHAVGEDPSTPPFRISGTVESLQVASGGSVRFSGQVRVLLSSGSTVPGAAGQLVGDLVPLTGPSGDWVGGTQKFGSSLATPVGTPIERFATSGGTGWGFGQPLAFTQTGDEYLASFNIDSALPTDLPDGLYRLFFDVFWDGAATSEPIGGFGIPRGMVTQPGAMGPTLRVGNPAQPKLPFMLFVNEVHNGVRGAEDPSQAFRTSQKIVESASFTILAPTHPSGAPRSYRIEPTVSAASWGDRALPGVPLIGFHLPSGQVSATITGPSSQATLGPAPIVQTRSSTPSTVGGEHLNWGGGNLGDPLEVVAAPGSMSHVFVDAGWHTIQVTGSVDDHSGFTWVIDGEFKVYVADSLDLDPPVLPGVPFAVGESLPIALQVNPSVESDVEIEVRFAPNSDPNQVVTQTFTGTTNRFGHFFDGDVFTFSSPGEYAVEFRAFGGQGDQPWAGVLAWSGVVAETDPAIIVHGRRGIDGALQPTRDRYLRTDTGIPAGPNHMNFPYHSGDVLLQTDDDAVNVRASFEDPIDAVSADFLARPSPSHVEGGTIAERFAIGEAPFLTFTSTGIDPALDPGGIDLWAYFYGAVSRPGVRVRAGVSEDNTGAWYWRFLDQYTAQPGMGVEGDRPTDVKLQYLGGVIRTTTDNHYARYASLWVELPDGDPVGSRVVAPLSEPLMRVEGEDITIFALLTLVEPGSVLEVGDTFGLAGQVGPPVTSTVNVELVEPGGAIHHWQVTTNEIGGFYIPAATMALTTPGLYTVRVGVESAGVTGALFTESEFMLPVVPTSTAPLALNLPVAGVVSDVTVTAALNAPAAVTARSLITTPGWILENESVTSNGQPVSFLLDGNELRAEYPLIDLTRPDAHVSGLADEFVWVITVGDGSTLQARRVVLFGPQLWDPE